MPFCHLVLKSRRPRNPAYRKELKTLGDHIRQKRLDLGLLQRDVAERLRVTESTVWNWENNASSPDWHYWSPVVSFLGYDPLPSPLTLPERLISFRKLRGLSQKMMARRLGVDPSTLARWERGERMPRGQMAGVVQAVFRTSSEMHVRD